MTIGSTSGKEPDWIEDGDLKSPEELRGAMKDIIKANLSVAEKATVHGIAVELDVMKQRLAATHEQMQSLIGLYGTLLGEFRQFQTQRVIELQSRGTGSTTPEDMEDGP